MLRWPIVAGMLLSSFGCWGGEKLAYAPAPVDNPVKGLAPYQKRAGTNFPCSMEFNYLPLRALVKGPNLYDWTQLENLISDIASRGRQTIFRIYLDYPGQPSGVPDYLIQEGLKITQWNSDKARKADCFSPDYEDPRLRECLTNFIAALGQKYDGDPRLAYITAGLLGLWGEWHTLSRSDLWASNLVQKEILDAYERTFKTTRVLLRYPARQGEKDHAANADRPMGFHDDSFAYATLPDSEGSHSWFFLNLLTKAGTLEKWPTQPIGGEVRPEVWGCCFDEPGCEPAGQEFAKCIEATHVTWLMDSGAFEMPMTPERLAKAARLVRRMGYEFYVSEASAVCAKSGSLEISVTIENKGVAPFYYDWPIELAAMDVSGNLAATWRTAWNIRRLVSSGPAVEWKHSKAQHDLKAGSYKLLMRVINPMPNGRPLGFANASMNADKPGWLTLSPFTIP